MDNAPGSPYLSELIPLPGPAAIAALDRHRVDVSGLRLDDPDARLELHGTAATRAIAGPRYEPLRRYTGTLAFGRTRIDVEVELLPWSEQSSELNLRPAAGRFPRRWSARRHAAYTRAATAVLRALVAELGRTEIRPATKRRARRSTVAA
jgi:hypothetical protein